MIREASILSQNTALALHQAAVAPALTPGGVVTSEDLHAFCRCPEAWRARAATEPRGGDSPAAVLDAVSLGGNTAAKLYAPRPETYTTSVLECPSCRSVGKGASCTRCGQVRRKKHVVRPWAAAAAECRGWAAAAEVAGKTIVPGSLHTHALGAWQALRADSLCAGLLKDAKRNLVLRAIYEDEATGVRVPLVSLCQIVPAEHSGHYQALARICWSRSAEETWWTGLAASRGLFVAAALDLALFNAATEDGRNQYAVLVVEAEPPYTVGRRLLSRELLATSQRRLFAALAAFALCRKNDVWPGLDTDAQGQAAWTTVEAPAWWNGGGAQSGMAPAAAQPAASGNPGTAGA